MLSATDRNSTGLGSKEKLSGEKNDNKIGFSKKSVRIDTSNNKEKLPLRRNISDRSHWKKDSSTKACSNCHSKFGVYMRKHHCRKCGEIICDSCSNFVEVTKNDFIFHTEQANLVGTNQRFCCKCTREREGDEKAVMAKSYSKKGGFNLGLGVVQGLRNAVSSNERISNVDGIPIDDTKSMVESIKKTPIMAFFNRDTTGNQPPMYVGHLKIIVKSAENLLPADLNGKADPYVKILLKGKTSFGEDWDPHLFGQKLSDIKAKTSVKPVTLFPVWNEQINFKVPRADAYLHIEVWDKDVFSKSEVMAYCRVELEDLMAESAAKGKSNGHALHKSYLLKDYKTNKDAGTLNLSLEFNYNFWGYLLSRYWPEQLPKVNDPPFNANRTIKHIQDLL